MCNHSVRETALCALARGYNASPVGRVATMMTSADDNDDDCRWRDELTLRLRTVVKRLDRMGIQTYNETTRTFRVNTIYYLSSAHA